MPIIATTLFTTLRQMPFIEGLLIGFATIIFVGPVFFTLLQATLNMGIKAGLSVAFGIIISDILCVVLCFYGVQFLFTTMYAQFWTALLGTVILFSMGILYILRPSPVKELNNIKTKDLFTYFSKGFLVNFVNPFVFFIWIAIVAMANEKYSVKVDVYLVIFGVLTGIFSTDLAKVALAHKIKSILQPNVLKITFKIVGLVLIAFGIRLLIYLWNI